MAPFLLCLLQTTFNFLPFLFLAGKDLFNLHCSRLTSSCRYIKSLVTVTFTTRMGFFAEVCRGMQRGAISLLPESIRRQPRALLVASFPLCISQEQLFAPCKSSIMSEKLLTYKDDSGLLFVSPAIQKRRNGLTCVHPGALSFTAQLAPQFFGSEG